MPLALRWGDEILMSLTENRVYAGERSSQQEIAAGLWRARDSCAAVRRRKGSSLRFRALTDMNSLSKASSRSRRACRSRSLRRFREWRDVVLDAQVAKDRGFLWADYARPCAARRWIGSEVTFRPSMRTSPASGRIRPTIM